MKNGKVQIGIIGCGGIAKQKHLPSLKLFPDQCELVAFCDLKEDRAQWAAKEYGTPDAKVYVDYHALLADPAIDVVHVLTPNVSHSPITVAAFEAGKHVLCEKPMAHNTEAAQKMMDAWKKSGKLFTIGYQNRFREEIQSLHASCEKGELGEIYFAKAHALRRRAVPTWGVFPDKSQQGGGPLIDIGTHALDITLWMMDNYRPKSVTGSVFQKLGTLENGPEGNLFGPWDPKTYEVEDSAFGMIKMEDGATIMLEASWALNILDAREAATTLCGTQGGATINSGMGVSRNELIYNRAHAGMLTEEKNSAAGHIDYFEGSSNAPGALEAKQWLAALKGEGEPLVKPQQAFVVTQILDAIYRSAESGKEIQL